MPDTVKSGDLIYFLTPSSPFNFLLFPLSRKTSFISSTSGCWKKRLHSLWAEHCLSPLQVLKIIASNWVTADLMSDHALRSAAATLPIMHFDWSSSERGVQRMSRARRTSDRSRWPLCWEEKLISQPADDGWNVRLLGAFAAPGVGDMCTRDYRHHNDVSNCVRLNELQMAAAATSPVCWWCFELDSGKAILRIMKKEKRESCCRVFEEYRRTKGEQILTVA